MHIGWDQLQTIEALVRTGTLEAAAKELALRHTSVSRRIDALEETLGVPLFTRGGRLSPTPLAIELAQQASAMRERALQIDGIARGLARAREGRVIITTTDVLAPLLLRALAATEVSSELEVMVSDRVEALTPGVVDLALRPSHEPGGSLTGRQLGLLEFGVFRGMHGEDGWVLPSRSLREKTSMRWWREIPQDARGKLTCDSLLAMRDACIAGLGRAVLPTFLGLGDPRLELERTLGVGTPLWLLAPTTRLADRSLRTLRDRLFRSLKSLEGVWRSETSRTPSTRD